MENYHSIRIYCIITSYKFGKRKRKIENNDPDDEQLSGDFANNEPMIDRFLFVLMIQGKNEDLTDISHYVYNRECL